MSKTTETFSPYDTADYLNSAADVAAYLGAVLDESDDDPAAIARAFGTVARVPGVDADDVSRVILAQVAANRAPAPPGGFVRVPLLLGRWHHGRMVTTPPTPEDQLPSDPTDLAARVHAARARASAARMADVHADVLNRLREHDAGNTSDADTGNG